MAERHEKKNIFITATGCQCYVFILELRRFETHHYARCSALGNNICSCGLLLNHLWSQNVGFIINSLPCHAVTQLWILTLLLWHMQLKQHPVLCSKLYLALKQGRVKCFMPVSGGLVFIVNYLEINCRFSVNVFILCAVCVCIFVCLCLAVTKSN